MVKKIFQIMGIGVLVFFCSLFGGKQQPLYAQHNVSCNSAYYHTGNAYNVKVPGTSGTAQLRMTLLYGYGNVRINIKNGSTVLDTLNYSITTPKVTTFVDTRNVPAGSTITYEFLYVVNGKIIAPARWMPDNVVPNQATCGTGCQLPTGGWLAILPLSSMLSLATEGGFTYTDLSQSYTLFLMDQRTKNTVDTAAVCVNDQADKPGTVSDDDFNDAALIWTVKTVAEQHAPTVLTVNPATVIATNYAIVSGNVTTDGGSAITERGIVYSKTNATPTVADTKGVADTVATGEYRVSIENLTANTKYYARAYAKNAIGLSYGNVIEFTTKVTVTAPTVLTINPATAITINSATVSGNVTSDGGSSITERGIVYSKTNATPTVADSKGTSAGNTGIFEVSLTALTSNTKYYARAYAKNSVGTSYGVVIDFTTTTQATAPTVLTISPATAITLTSAKVSGNVTSDGGSAITERGIVYSKTNAIPTIADSKVVKTGTTGVFEAALTGLTSSTKYYARAYAKNAIGISYGEVINFTAIEHTPTDTGFADDALLYIGGALYVVGVVTFMGARVLGTKKHTK